MLNALLRNSEKTRLVRSFNATLTAQARHPAFFRDFGVADTIDGRFDLVALHAWLIFGRLRSAGMSDVAHALSDAIFVGFDEALRDLGAGDMGLGRKIKQLGEAFNGRIQAYEVAVGEVGLAAAILRNIYRGDLNRKDDALMIARYAIDVRARLSTCDPFTSGFEFGPPPERQA